MMHLCWNSSKHWVWLKGHLEEHRGQQISVYLGQCFLYCKGTLQGTYHVLSTIRASKWALLQHFVQTWGHQVLGKVYLKRLQQKQNFKLILETICNGITPAAMLSTCWWSNPWVLSSYYYIITWLLKCSWVRPHQICLHFNLNYTLVQFCD